CEMSERGKFSLGSLSRIAYGSPRCPPGSLAEVEPCRCSPSPREPLLPLRLRPYSAVCSHLQQGRRLMKRLALAFLCSALALGLGSGSRANPSGIPAGSKLVFNFNVIGYPAGKSYDGNCGDGHRIFVNREANKATVQVTNTPGSWSILDCNATSDHTAML